MANDAIRNRYLQDGAGVMSQPRLLVMVYDRLVLDLEQALEGLPNSEWDLVNRKLTNAQAIVLELHSALQIDAWEGGRALSDLYTWFDSEITLANVRKSEKHIKPILKMIRDLRDAWVQAQNEVIGSAAPSSFTAPAPLTGVKPA